MLVKSVRHEGHHGDNVGLIKYLLLFLGIELWRVLKQPYQSRRNAHGGVDLLLSEPLALRELHILMRGLKALILATLG